MTDTHTHQSDLNEKFFRDVDAQLIAKLKSRLQHDEMVKTLGATCGIEDDAILNELVDRGVTTETMSAFCMVPLVAVAWSDGTIQNEERVAILKAAAENGIDESSPSQELLASWLEHKIPTDLVDAWKQYTHSLSKSLSPAAVDAIRREVIERTEQIASAAGGILGIGSISSSEADVIADLKTAFPE